MRPEWEGRGRTGRQKDDPSWTVRTRRTDNGAQRLELASHSHEERTA